MRTHHRSHRSVLHGEPRLTLAELLECRRLLAAVELDPTWGDFGNASITSSIIIGAQATGNKVLTLTIPQQSNEASLEVARLTSAGRIDSTFGTGGYADVPVAFDWYEPWTASFAAQSDGKVLVLVGRGYGTDEFALSLTRLTASGQRDATFGSNGVAEVTFPGTISQGCQGCDISIASDGKIFVSSETYDNKVNLARFTATGQLDATFDADGRVQAIAAVPSATVHSMAVQADGKLLVTGSGFAAARFNVDGSLDANFGTGGVMTGLDEYNIRRGIFVTPAGDILLTQYWTDGGGLPEGEFGLTRLTAAGVVDTTFNRIADPVGTVANDPVTGRLLMMTGTGYGADYIRRLMPDGSTDPDFNNGQPISELSSSESNFAVASDGDVILSASSGVTRYAPRVAVEMGGNGTLVLNGEDSADTLTVEPAGGNVKVTRNGSITSYPLADVENVFIRSFGGGDTVAVSIDVPSRIEGDDGNDTITTAAGADTVHGGAGNDIINGSGGNDVLLGDEGSDSIVCGAGNDITSDAWGANTIAGGDGNDLIGSAWDESNPGNVASITGGNGDDTIFGTIGSDTLSGNAGSDWLYGFGGSDLLVGNGGNDRLEGGPGPDRLYGRAGIDRIDGGAGGDRIYGDAGDDFLLQGGPGNDQVDGGAGNDMVCGGSGNDQLFCGGGADTLIGNKGDDILSAADSVGDLLDGGKGIDGAYADADTLDGMVSVEQVLT